VPPSFLAGQVGWVNSEALLVGGAVIVAGAGAVWDLITYRIPNRLTYTAMVIGLISQVCLLGWSGLWIGPLGLLLGGAIFLVLYLLRTMGAGDVKLMAAVGAFAGPRAVVEIALYSAIAGGVIALGVAIFKGRLRRTFENVGHLVRFHAVMGAETHPTVNLENPDALRFAYGAAIFVGTLTEFLLHTR
jgi:prepilin peptidase CpaA